MSALQVASRVQCTEAEGPHRRTAVWVAGCSIRCAGCCNPELFDAQAGRPMSRDALLAQFAQAQAEAGIEGISLLGGEPMDQAPALASLLPRVQAMGLGVIVFSGYRLEQLQQRENFAELFASIDTLVDGPFEARALESRISDRRRFVGSTNQRLIHRSSRYADPKLWQGDAGIEVHISAQGALSLHGEPATARRVAALLARAD